jgi:hypothetical protein
VIWCAEFSVTLSVCKHKFEPDASVCAYIWFVMHNCVTCSMGTATISKLRLSPSLLAHMDQVVICIRKPRLLYCPLLLLINMHLMFEGTACLESRSCLFSAEVHSQLGLVRLASSRRVWVRPQSALWRTKRSSHTKARREATERKRTATKNCEW